MYAIYYVLQQVLGIYTTPRTRNIYTHIKYTYQWENLSTSHTLTQLMAPTALVARHSSPTSRAHYNIRYVLLIQLLYTHRR